MSNDEIRGALEKQLQLLSERSNSEFCESAHDLAELTGAMRTIVDSLLAMSNQAF